jgi:hypothetical protein
MASRLIRDSICQRDNQKDLTQSLLATNWGVCFGTIAGSSTTVSRRDWRFAATDR